MRVPAAITLLLASAPVAAADIEGRWRSPGGNSIIEIAPCGSNMCGTVAWASERAKQDAAKTTSQLIGTQLLTGLEERKPGRWQGKLFVPDRDMRVTAKIQLASPRQLKVTGCAAAIICHTQLWNKFDDPLPE
jgi:uncharacterized protein (DUF2147 family)